MDFVGPKVNSACILHDENVRGCLGKKGVPLRRSTTSRHTGGPNGKKWAGVVTWTIVVARGGFRAF